MAIRGTLEPSKLRHSPDKQGMVSYSSRGVVKPGSKGESPFETSNLLITSHFEQQLYLQEESFKAKIAALTEYYEMQLSNISNRPSSEESNFRSQAEGMRRENQSLRKQNQDIENSYKFQIIDLEKQLRIAKEQLQEASKSLNLTRQEFTELQRVSDSKKKKYSQMKAQLKNAQDSVRALEKEIDEHKEVDLYEHLRVLRENEALKQQNNNLIRSLAREDEQRIKNNNDLRYSCDEPLQFRESNLRRKADLINSDTVTQSAPWDNRQSEPPRQQDFTVKRNLEKKLADLQLQEKKLMEDYRRIPNFPRKQADIDKKNQLEMDIDITYNQINSLKDKIRKYN